MSGPGLVSLLALIVEQNNRQMKNKRGTRQNFSFKIKKCVILLFEYLLNPVLLKNGMGLLSECLCAKKKAHFLFIVVEGP